MLTPQKQMSAHGSVISSREGPVSPEALKPSTKIVQGRDSFLVEFEAIGKFSASEKEMICQAGHASAFFINPESPMNTSV